MGLFDFVKKKEKDKDNGKKGGFVGFVLLSDESFDPQQAAKDLGESLGTEAPETEKDGIIVTDHKGCMVSLMFLPKPVPGEEAEHFAGGNYMWKDAVETAKKHKAQIIVAVMGGESPIESGKIFVKAVLAALKQENAVAVYTDGAVHEPGFYRTAATAMDNGMLPILNWIWLGLYRDKKRQGIYTFGMKNFGKDEMEIYAEGEADLNEIRICAADMVSYVLENDVTLKPGETIGMTAEQKMPITKSKGIALDGETLKIKYMP
ncbi:MAG: DUF4261 domain-containing protein [Ruminococcus sp.]|nr:DUF4261 domain-containing protein [Ruminococcus sp.]